MNGIKKEKSNTMEYSVGDIQSDGCIFNIKCVRHSVCMAFEIAIVTSTMFIGVESASSRLAVPLDIARDISLYKCVADAIIGKYTNYTLQGDINQ